MVLLMALSLVSCHKQPKQQKTRKVHAVQQKQDPLPSPESDINALAIHLNNLSVLPIEHHKHASNENYFLLSGGEMIVHSALPDSLYFEDGHPFINSVRTAYASHRPLILSPDAVWLVIARGFNMHVLKNSEKLRHQLVHHEGKKKLEVTCEQGLIEMPAEKWEPYFSKFTDQIAQWADSSLIEQLTNNFSTTTPASYVASQISIMSTMQNYFEYLMDEGCGIPTIYLEGTEEDWQKVVQKAHSLRQYDLDWWMDELEPVLQKIADAAGGEVDTLFWQSICKKREVIVNDDPLSCGEGPYRVDEISGWVIKFYPYDRDGNRNSFVKIDDGAVSHLPIECATVPLEYREYKDTLLKVSLDLQLSAGLVGMAEDPKTFALSPQIAWYVVTKEECSNSY